MADCYFCCTILSQLPRSEQKLMGVVPVKYFPGFQLVVIGEFVLFWSFSITEYLACLENTTVEVFGLEVKGWFNQIKIIKTFSP